MDLSMQIDGSVGFDELGIEFENRELLERISVLKPTPIQSAVIPLILNLKDVVVHARAGSGKRLAYLIPVLQSLLSSPFERDPVVSVPMLIIIVPTSELAQQVYGVMKPLIEVLSIPRCEPVVSVLKTPILSDELRSLMKIVPDVVISTANCVLSCLEKGFLKARADGCSLPFLVIEEIHEVMLNYPEELNLLMDHIPKSCQRLFFTSGPRVCSYEMETFVPRNPYVITLLEDGEVSSEIYPLNAEHYYILCHGQRRFHHVLALFRALWLGRKVLIFTKSASMSILLQHILNEEAAWTQLLRYKARALNAHTLELFGEGKIDCLIVDDDSFGDLSESELSAIRLKNLDLVVHFEMPYTVHGYAGRFGHLIKGKSTVISYSLITPEDEGLLEAMKIHFGRYGRTNFLPYSNGKLAAFYNGRVKFYLQGIEERLEIEKVQDCCTSPSPMELCN